jgi:anti-anti-sigma regulatory factor
LFRASLEFDVEDLGRSVVVHVRGEATCERAAYLDEKLSASVNMGSSHMILDLAGLTSVSA